MFGLSEAGTKLVVGAIVTAVLLAIVAGIFGAFSHMEHQVVDLNRQNAAQGVVAAVQASDIDAGKKAGQVSNDAAVATANDAADAKKKSNTTAVNLVKKTTEIKQAYNALPEEQKTTAAFVAETEKLSEAGIDSLWETYCGGVSDAASCPVTQPQPQSAQGAQHG